MNLNMPPNFQLVEEAVPVAHSEGTHLKAEGSPPWAPSPISIGSSAPCRSGCYPGSAPTEQDLK